MKVKERIGSCIGKIRKADYRHYIMLAVFVASALCLGFFFRNGLFRLWEAVRDLGLSIAYYFCEVFAILHGISPTVKEFSSLPFDADMQLPFTWEEFKVLLVQYGQTLISAVNVQNYFFMISDVLLIVARVLTLLFPLVFALFLLMDKIIKTHVVDDNHDSKELVMARRLKKRLYEPVRRWVVSFIAFLRENKLWIILVALVWALSFRIAVIVVEAFAYYFYFAVSFDVLMLYKQVVKLFLDAMPMIRTVPVPVWIIAALYVFDRCRKRVAYDRLRHLERKNMGFIISLPIVTMNCAEMGKKKTTILTDMALITETIFRTKAGEILMKYDVMFPNMPWILVERELVRALHFHQIYNLPTFRIWVRKKASRFFKKMSREKIFMYDYEKYGLHYDNNLTVVNVWEAIEEYVCAYYVYTMPSALIISNFSIRNDSVQQSLGNFPLWNFDCFEKTSMESMQASRFAHIIDFDAFRLGKKVKKDNPWQDSFDAGCVCITEIGKERGNRFELEEKKKSDEETNQNNDLFNSEIKMIRHSATIDNFPFVRFFCDEQRPESWGADARHLCNIVHVEDSADTRLTLSFFALTELFCKAVMGRFKSMYRTYRFYRSDNTLFMTLLKRISAKIEGYYNRIYNTFGVIPVEIDIEKGVQDGKLKRVVYYLMTKKIYSDRFSTDCFSDFFMEKGLRSRYGLNDLPTYAGVRASFDELSQQNSYFVNELLNGMRGMQEESVPEEVKEEPKKEKKKKKKPIKQVREEARQSALENLRKRRAAEEQEKSSKE